MQNLIRFHLAVIFAAFLFLSANSNLFAQTQTDKPLTQQEFVKLLFASSNSDVKRSELVETVRKRGIGFELTSGVRGLIASKSGNDEVLRRTIEESARRKANPTAAALPSEKEAGELLEKTRKATLEAVDEMPDFVVKQQVARSYAYAGTNNFKSSDRLTVAVSYRAEGSEEYRILALNGIPQPDKKEQPSYQEVGGTSSTGEFVTVLASIFKPESLTKFETVDTDLLRGRRCIVYSFEIKRENSKQTISTKDVIEQSTISGSSGKIWIDREINRVLRVESNATEIPADFPVKAASRIIDYDWVTITNQKYLLPINSDVRLTSRYDKQLYETRNQIAFRNYQKYGTDVKILDDDEVVDEKPAPQTTPKDAPTKPIIQTKPQS